MLQRLNSTARETLCDTHMSEIHERADVLTRKLTVISDSAKAFADIIDIERSARLELIIVVLIVLEIVIGGLQLWIH
jgi:uncharacterized Rmd1/YagE family protein